MVSYAFALGMRSSALVYGGVNHRANGAALGVASLIAGVAASHLNSGTIALSGGGNLYFPDIAGFETTGSIDVSG